MRVCGGGVAVLGMGQLYSWHACALLRLSPNPKQNDIVRFTIGIVVIQKADVYMFDEPSSYLDVKQRCVRPPLLTHTRHVTYPQTSPFRSPLNPTKPTPTHNSLRAALTIRALVAGEGGGQTYVLVVEHDLAVLDYLSDYICCLYGTPSAYGVVTMPFSVREGINMCVRV